MADNGQIDNLYVNFEVGGNAEEKLDEIDKALAIGAEKAKRVVEEHLKGGKVVTEFTTTANKA